MGFEYEIIVLQLKALSTELDPICHNDKILKAKCLL